MQPVLRQTKRLALLAYMAVEKPGQFHRRDHLLGLFWPESDLKGGRASLSQAVHFLRKYLGNEAIVNRGDEEIGLALDLISCDAAAFQQHLAAGQYAEAMEQYGGPLLTGVFLGEAEGFEQWVEQKRDTLQRDAMRACVALADAAATREDHGDVAHWLRRAIASFPYDENLHRRLISALDRAGDRAAALRAYEDLEQTLRTDFEAEPSAETKELMRAVRARSDAQSLPAIPVIQQSAGRAIPAAFVALPHRPRRQLGAIAGIIMLVVAGMAWGAWATREPSSSEAPVNRIAVLFFDDASADRELGYLADGLTTTLIDHLGQVRRLEIISQNGVRPFRGDSIPLDSIARQLEVGTIVGGTITRSGEQLRVNVEIVKGASGIVVRSKTFERPVGELFALLDDVAAEVGSFLRNSVGEEVKLQRYQSETDNVAAWQGVQKAQELFSDALTAADRGNAGSAEAMFEEASTALKRAAELDKHWAAPHVTAARIHNYRAWLALMSGKPDAQREFLDAGMSAANEALERDPKNAAGLLERGRLQFTRWQMTPQSPANAEALLRSVESDLARAVTLDPDNARAESALSLFYDSQGRFEEARQAARRALAADAYLEDANQIFVRLFQASFEVGDDEAAGQWCDEVRRRMNNQWPAAYCDLVLLGWRTDQPVDARKALHILENFGANDPPELRAAMWPRLMLVAAATVARGGDRLRAEAMISEARAAAPHDRELKHFEAALRIRLNQPAEARKLVEEYIAQDPKVRARLENSRMFKPLHDAGRAAAIR